MKIIEQGYEIITPINREEILKSIEIAGRTAYKSEERIGEGSAAKFVGAIMARGHESVIEHISLTVRFITDRGVTHELVRHRLCAFTQESTRYCNYAGKQVQFINPVFWDETMPEYWDWVTVMADLEKAYNSLISKGAKPQEARSVLPNSLKTEIVVTANLREWRHILRLRTAQSAHPQMRALMLPLLTELQNKLPEVFGGIIDG